MVSGMRERGSQIGEINQRSRDIFRHIVEAYVVSGEPVGSRTLSRKLGLTLSPATIRNVMADLEEMGLLYAPHTSAGRLPTEAGLRLFVDGLLEVGRLDPDERESIEARCAASGRSVERSLEEAIGALSGLARCAGLVVAPKSQGAVRHIEFVALGQGRALAVMVDENGVVENRVLEVPAGLPPSALIEAGNYLSAKMSGRTFEEAREEVTADLVEARAQLNELTAKVVEAGLATWAGDEQSTLIVRGQAHLLEDVTALTDLERIRNLFEALEEREQGLKLLDLTSRGDGVQIFIGAQSPLFRLAGCTTIIAPYRNSR